MELLNGFLLINKPVGITSFDCIRKIRQFLPYKTKIGHAGTLDDFAQGLLIICIGKEATRLVETLMQVDKEYVVRAKLGELTDSLDLTGEIVQETSVPFFLVDDLKNALEKLGSSYEQVPPIYSALKH